MVVAVVDDHRLLTLLTSETPPAGRFATTCSWWWRLTSAGSGRRRGALSRRIDGLDPVVGAALHEVIRALPSRLEVVDMRVLMPAMGALAAQHAVNQLAAEAVAAAAYLDTSIEVEIDAPGIRAAARAEGVGYRVV